MRAMNRPAIWRRWSAVPAPFAVASIYLPNGNPIGTEKFDYKLAWMARLNAHAKDLLALEEPLALVGDYNVIPEARDASHPEQWTKDALAQPESRGAFQALKWLGLTEAFMAIDGAPESYTFWDYQAGAWQRNNGIRIDHALLSPRPPTCSPAAPFTNTCAAGKNPPITSPS